MDAPPALTASSFGRSRHGVEAHDHAVCVYESPGDLVAPLARFLDEGVDRRQLSVFIHSFASEAEAWDLVERARPDARKLRDELVLVSLYTDAFQGPHPEIDYAHVTSVVTSVLERSHAKGHRGARIFVDASRRYFDESRDAEWFAFETWLGRRLHASVGLVCAYRRDHATHPERFPRMLETHAYRFDAPQ